MFHPAPELGSSGSLTAGLVAALFGYRHRVVSAQSLAEQACHIAIDILTSRLAARTSSRRVRRGELHPHQP